ncbi:MAG: hypothetical protein ACOZAO_01805 [Patescibacteria group bacterium]
MSRVCSNCNSTLGNYDSFFCSECGNLLPENVVRIDPGLRTKVFEPQYQKVASKHSNNLNKVFNKSTVKLFLTLLPLFLLAVVLYLGIPFINALINTKTLSVELVELPTNLSVIEVENDLHEDFFGADLIDSYVPFDADLYVEINDLQGVLNSYVQDTSLGDDFSKEFLSQVSDHFAIFAIVDESNVSWGAVFIPNSPDEIATLVNSVENSTWKFKLIGNRLIVANNDQIFNEVEAVSTKLSRSLSLNPSYARVKAVLPKSGKSLIMFVGDEGFQSLNTINPNSVTPEMLDIINLVAESNLQAVVIK